MFIKIISKENITMAPKTRSKLKAYTKTQEKQIRCIIKSIDRLHSNKHTTLETRLSNSDDEVILYNASNRNLPRIMVIATATELNTIKPNRINYTYI